MNNVIKELLEAEIEAKIQNLQHLTTGSAEMSTEINDLVKLYNLKNADDKLQLEFEEKAERRKLDEAKNISELEMKKIDLDIKKEDILIKKANFEEVRTTRENDEMFKNLQFTEDFNERYFKHLIEIAGVVVPMMFYASWMKKGFRFEETGTFTSTTFKGLFNRFKPTK
ncbi:MAG: hypothetical protein R3Y12_04300 [Clostridia bacterium]